MTTAREIMSSDVSCVREEDTLLDAAKQMAARSVGALPVCGKDDHLLGMITDRDIAVRAVAEGKSPDTKVADVMSREVLYCFEDQNVEDVSRNMGEEKVRRMPVVNRDKRLVGIISFGDLARSEQADTAGEVIAEISEPGGQHSQTRH